MTAVGVVTHGCEFRYLLEDRRRYTPLPVTMLWHPTDPVAVTLRFPRREWVFARELLVTALTSATAGDGDVRFSAVDDCPDYVLLTLNSPSGHAKMHVERADLIDFVVATEYVPAADPDPLIGCLAGADRMPDSWLPGLDDPRWTA